MEFTNKLDLPEYIVDWLQHDDYDHNHDPYVVSATTLMKPPRAVLLAERHHKKIETDVSELVSSRLGAAIHNSIEVLETEGFEKEQRIHREVQLGAVTYTVSGKFDLLQDNKDGTFTLRDIKTTSVWAYIMGGKDEDYSTQMSVYRWLLSGEGRNVTDYAFIDFFFTDWQSSKAKEAKRSKKPSDYPLHRLHPGYRIELMSLKETEQWIMERLQLIEENKLKSDEDLLPCTRKELWATNEVYAVIKPNAKKASKLCDTRQEAEEYIQIKGLKTARVQERPPKVRRCNYCAAFPFCNQGQSYDRQGIIA